MKSFSVAILIILLSSCANLKHTNFSRQKFTDLKMRTVDDEESTTENKSHETPYVPVDQTTLNQEPNEPVVQSQTESNTETPSTHEITQQISKMRLIKKIFRIQKI
jgi:hypothetical protein